MVKKQYKAVAAVGAVVLILLLMLGVRGSAVADAKSKAVGLTEEKKTIHLLNRIGYGARPDDIERVKRMGIDKYIDQQLHPERINDSAVEARLAGLDSLHMSLDKIYERYPAPGMIARQLGVGRARQDKKTAKAGPTDLAQGSSPADDVQAKQNQREARRQIFDYYEKHGLKPPQRLLQELQAQDLIRAVYSERQLQEVMSDFWFNHFNIYWGKGADKWLTTDFEMNAIRPHTMGKFKDLLMATAKSPAMLFYLDNYLSSSPDAKIPDRRRLGQHGSFPRRLGPFGNPRADQPQAQSANPSGKRKPGINENYARELMELHTMGVDGGYTQKDVQEVARCFTGWTLDRPRQNGGFIFRDRMHDNGEKTVLGQKIPAGGGIKDGERVIDILTHHPSTAKFISTKLVRRFVSDNPPPSLVDRVSAVYRKTDGNLREMLRTIFTSPEFYAADAYRAKIKSPFELAVSAIRALGGDTDGAPALAQLVAKMGQPLYQYQPPTGYPDRADQWVNTGALLERMNFGLALSANRIPGTTVDLTRTASGLAGAPADRVLDRVITLLLAGDVSAQTRAILNKQLKEGVPVKDTSADSQITKIVGLVIGSPEFQRR